MNINVNTPLEELLREWAKISYSMFKRETTTKEELVIFREVSRVLDTKGVTKLEILNIAKEKYTLRYTKQGTEFTKDVDIV